MTISYLFTACFLVCSINKHHAILTVSDKGEAELKPADQGSKTKLNGLPLTGPTVLSHKDRILFGELSWPPGDHFTQIKSSKGKFSC